MDHMEIVDVINNLKKWESWDYKCYPLSKAEAESIIKFFDDEIDYSVIEEGINGLDCD